MEDAQRRRYVNGSGCKHEISPDADLGKWHGAGSKFYASSRHMQSNTDLKSYYLLC